MNFKSLLSQLDQLNEATEKTKTGIIPVALWGVATVHLIAEKRIRRMAFVNK